MFLCIFICCVVFIGLKLYLCSKQVDPEPIFGKYRLPGKWYSLKYIVFLMIIYFRKWSSLSGDNGARPGQGVKSHKRVEDMDCAQRLSDHAKAFDAAFFIAANKDGYFIIAGCERRQMGIVNGLFYLIVPGKGVLCSPKIPDTLLFGAKVNEFGAEGLLLTPKDPMKRWHISYSGKMWYKDNPTKIVDVSFEGEWLATSEFFDYDTELDARAIARSIAREPWSSKYFENLKTAHQSHYEQFGTLNADFTIDDEKYKSTLDSFRDHSYGHKRDWALMHRYAFHHIFLANGWKISIGVICQPCTASVLEAGVIWTPINGNEAVESCDLQLYEHGENGIAPTDYAFMFRAGGKMYTVQVDVIEQSIHYVSSHWDARMVERFAKFTVNGIQGWGVTEFHYNNQSGRPKERLLHDPEWYQALRDNA